MRATLKDPHTVRLGDGREVSAKHVLVAVGGHPVVPDFPGREHAVTSDDMFDLEAFPRRIVILGGGYIACEFAFIMRGLGAEVTLAYRGDRLLRKFDRDLSDHVMEAAREKGIDLRLNADIGSIERTNEGLVTRLGDGSAPVSDCVLAATGRAPSTAGLGLEEIGVRLGRSGAVEVDEYSRSSLPSVYAIGDVTSRLELTPVAIREGMAFVDTVFRGTPTTAERGLVATAVFSQPEIGTIGLTEEEARVDGHEVEIYRSKFRPLLHTLTGREERDLMKLVVDRPSRKILGVHLAGHGAAEMIQLAAVSVMMGATKDDFDRTVAVHPTAAEELVTMRAPVGT
jgi:glutathione reductase (NADPH)